jgi:hypothetical protein
MPRLERFFKDNRLFRDEESACPGYPHTYPRGGDTLRFQMNLCSQGFCHDLPALQHPRLHVVLGVGDWRLARPDRHVLASSLTRQKRVHAGGVWFFGKFSMRREVILNLHSALPLHLHKFDKNIY